MKRISTLIITTLALYLSVMHTVIAQSTFTSLCVEEQSTGFHWQDGEWMRTKFVPEKFIVEKLDIQKSGNSSPEITPADCLGMKETSDSGFKNGCYNVREFGEESNPFSGLVCQEVRSGDEGEATLEQVICDGKITSIVFEPNGNFHYSKVHWLVRDTPETEEKDSLVLSVGRCSIL